MGNTSAGGIIKNAGNNLTKVDPQNNHGQMKRTGLKRSKRRGRRSSSRNRNLLRGMGNNKIVPEINLEQMRKTRNANNRKGLTGNKNRLEKNKQYKQNQQTMIQKRTPKDPKWPKYKP